MATPAPALEPRATRTRIFEPEGTRFRDDCSSIRIAGGTSTWETSRLKFCNPSRFACSTAIACAGAVVSNPIAKNTTWRSGLFRASSTASVGEYTIRTSPPSAFT